MLDTDVFGRSNDVAVEIGEGSGFLSGFDLIFGADEAIHCLGLINQLREDGIGAELYPDSAKMKKQMSYADSKKIPYVALIGSEEMKKNEITIKNMSTGEQSVLTLNELLQILK